jgi:5-keto 4-deoxyuronate isomerase
MKIIRKNIKVSAEFNEEDLMVLYGYINRVLSGGDMNKEERTLLKELRSEIREVAEKLENNIWYDKY